MISSQFAFPSSSAYAGSSQTGLAPSQDSGAQDSGANNSNANSQSFSHVFASHWASSSEGEQNNSHAAAVKRSQQDQDSDDQQNDDAGGAAAAQQQAPSQPSRPILPNLSALLGLPHSQQAPGAELSDAQSGAAEAPTDGAQTSASGAAAGASASKKSFSEVLAATNLTGLAKSIKPENGKSTQSREGNALNRNALGLPVGLEQLLADAKGTDTSEADAELEAEHAGGAASTTGNTAGEASTGVAAGAAGSPNAPIAFEMLLNPDGDSGAQSSADPMAPTQITAVAAQLQNAFSAAMSGPENPAAATTLTGAHEAAVESNPLAAPATIEARANSEERATTTGDAAPVKSTQADPAEGAPGREAVKNMRLQIEGENNQRIDVRLTDQGGALKVSVRSADPNLTQALQDHMPDLTNRLQQQHFRTEVWMPRSSESSDSGSSNARQFHSQGDTSGQDQSGRRQNGRQNNQPDWLEENLPSQAGTQGRTDHIWAQ